MCIYIYIYIYTRARVPGAFGEPLASSVGASGLPHGAGPSPWASVYLHLAGKHQVYLKRGALQGSQDDDFGKSFL